jgi:hypothetical protein
MGELVFTNLYNRLTEKQPVFDFMIKKDDFYINTHGVSVTEFDKSFTSYSNGLFYVLNKNNKPIYFNGVYLINARMRKERGYPGNLLRIRLITTTISGNFMYEKYIVSFRGNEIGELTISRLSNYENNSNLIINPFQSLEFSATYKVLNLNKLNVQYYGKSRVNKDLQKGVIDINFSIKCFSDKELTKQINDTITVTINVVNTGYIPESQ